MLIDQYKRGMSCTLGGLVAVVVSATSLATPPTLIQLSRDPFLWGTDTLGAATSGNGSVVVGQVAGPGNSAAVRWNTNAMAPAEDLGTLGGLRDGAKGVSYDGSVVVGSSLSNITTGARSAFRWTSNGGMQALGVLPGGFRSYGTGVSWDGSVVVGYSETSGDNRAFRWTSAGGMQDLGVFSGVRAANANAVSGDGRVVVGQADLNAGGTRAFRWTAETGMQPLGFLPGGNVAHAYATNVDGSVVVGWGNMTGGSPRAFRWTSAGMQSLGVLPGGNGSVAYAATGDGRWIVGYATTPTLQHAMLWTPETGIMDLHTYLPSLGVDLTGWTLTQALAISADGSTITGQGVFNGVVRGWAVSGLPVPAPGTGVAFLAGMAVAARRRRSATR